MINVYSLKRDGDVQLSKNFKVREFACKDGSDEILVDLKLVKVLQAIRDKLGKPVNINSAYRHLKYNLSIGSTSTSQHVYGKAADIVCAGVEPIEIARIADGMCVGGVGRYGTFVHVDTRTHNRYRANWLPNMVIVPTFLPTPEETAYRGRHGDDAVWTQAMLVAKGYNIAVDGRFGPATDKAVRNFQSARKLVVDGRVGPATRAALIK